MQTLLDLPECRKTKTIALDSRFASLIKRIMLLDDGMFTLTLVKEGHDMRLSVTRLGQLEKIG